MNTTDAMIGIALDDANSGCEQVVLYWHQRLILLQPASVALVHCTQDGGVSGGQTIRPTCGGGRTTHWSPECHPGGEPALPTTWWSGGG